MPKKLTTKDLIQRAEKIHENLFDYSKSIYINAKTKIEQLDGVLFVNEVEYKTTTHFTFNEHTTKSSCINIMVRINDKNEADNMNSKYFNDFYERIWNFIAILQRLRTG